MCQIMYLPQGSYINKKHVYTSQKNNPHGIGMMWVEDGRVKVFHGRKSYAELVTALNDHKSHNVIVHMRYATCGSKSIINHHPFKILDKERDGIDLYMMHNWTLPIDLPCGLRSDSYHFAQELRKYIREFGIEELYNPDNARNLGRVIGINNRVILLDSNGKVTFLNEESGSYFGKTVKRWYANIYSLKLGYREKTRNNKNLIIKRIKNRKKHKRVSHNIGNMPLRRYNITRYMFNSLAYD